MNESVELLLKRMESHPEEFAYEWGPSSAAQGKWDYVRHGVHERMNYIRRMQAGAESGKEYGYVYLPALPFLSDAEVETLYDKFNELNAKAFHNYVMSVIVTGEGKSSLDVAIIGSYANTPAVEPCY